MNAPPILAAARRRLDEVVERLVDLVRIESPTGDPAAVARVQDHLDELLVARGFRVRRIHEPGAGPHLLAMPKVRRRGRPLQLVLGHADTVWDSGTLETMPVRREEGRLHGPGTFDMKGGIAAFVTALDLVDELGLELPADPVLLVTADEEVGSPTSKRHVARIARIVRRAFVLEPPKGPVEGRIKTARKGMVRIDVEIEGVPAHAGLDPEAGASAIQEAAHLVQRLHALQDLDRGVSVNVGVIAGGTRPNVTAARATLAADARVPTLELAEELIALIEGLDPVDPRCRYRVVARLEVPPLARTPRNRALWRTAQGAAASLGIEIAEASVGGASDGNTAARYTAVLDGLGLVGDGAHAAHEHVVIHRIAERVALLTALLAAPLDPGSAGVDPSEGGDAAAELKEEAG